MQFFTARIDGLSDWIFCKIDRTSCTFVLQYKEANTNANTNPKDKCTAAQITGNCIALVFAKLYTLGAERRSETKNVPQHCNWVFCWLYDVLSITNHLCSCNGNGFSLQGKYFYPLTKEQNATIYQYFKAPVIDITKVYIVIR